MTTMFRQLGWNKKALYTESGLVCSFAPVSTTNRLNSEDNIEGCGG